MNEKKLIKYSEKLNKIIELSELCGKWSYHFDLIAWDNPKLLEWQKQSKQVKDKRKELIEDFLSELYIDLTEKTENKKPKHWTEEPLE
jgi:hypothetical protein